jgi:hypothetical protein
LLSRWFDSNKNKQTNNKQQQTTHTHTAKQKQKKKKTTGSERVTKRPIRNTVSDSTELREHKPAFKRSSATLKLFCLRAVTATVCRRSLCSSNNSFLIVASLWSYQTHKKQREREERQRQTTTGIENTHIHTHTHRQTDRQTYTHARTERRKRRSHKKEVPRCI